MADVAIQGSTSGLCLLLPRLPGRSHSLHQISRTRFCPGSRHSIFRHPVSCSNSFLLITELRYECLRWIGLCVATDYDGSSKKQQPVRRERRLTLSNTPHLSRYRNRRIGLLLQVSESVSVIVALFDESPTSNCAAPLHNAKLVVEYGYNKTNTLPQRPNS